MAYIDSVSDTFWQKENNAMSTSLGHRSFSVHSNEILGKIIKKKKKILLKIRISKKLRFSFPQSTIPIMSRYQ